MMERTLTFQSNGLRLSAILHEPSSAPQRRCGVLFCNAGLQAKAGPFRIYVRLARQLARLDFWSFRFDLPGIGDSEGVLSKIHFDVFSPVDVHAAIDAFCREAQLDEVIVLGLCGGARVALQAGFTDSRVKGILLISLPLMKASESAVQEESLHLLRFLRKARLPSSWIRFFTFRSDYRLLWRSLRSGLNPAAKRDYFDLHFVNMVKTALGQDQRLSFIYGSRDLFYESFQAVLAKQIPQWNGRAQSFCSCSVIEDAGHIFSEPSHQDQLIAEVSRWLTEKYRPSEQLESTL